MIINYDKDNGFSSILDGFKKEVPIVSSEANKFFEDLKNIQKINPDIPVDFSKFIKDNNIADESLKNFLNDTKYTEKSLDSYQTYLEKTGQVTSKFSSFTKLAGNALSTLGSFAVNALASWAISEAIGLAIKGIYNIVKAEEIAIEKGEQAQNAIKEKVQY